MVVTDGLVFPGEFMWDDGPPPEADAALGGRKR